MDTQDKTVLVRKDTSWGLVKYSPDNTTAKMVVDLVGTRTITDRMIRCLKTYGYTVQVTAQSEIL